MFAMPKFGDGSQVFKTQNVYSRGKAGKTRHGKDGHRNKG